MKDVLYMGHLGGRSFGDQIGIVKFQQFVNKNYPSIKVRELNIHAGDKIDMSANIFYLLGCGTCLSNLSLPYADQLLIDLSNVNRKYGVLGAGVYFEKTRTQKKKVCTDSPKSIQQTVKYLKNAQFIALRSEKCAELMKSIYDREYHVLYDVGLAIDWPIQKIKSSKPIMGVNFAPHTMSCLGAINVPKHVYHKMAAIVNEYSKIYDIIHISFNNKDDKFSKSTGSWGVNKYLSKINHRGATPQIIAGAMQNCDIFMGVRVHSDITAAAYGVPFLSITYTYPNKNFLDHIEYPHYVMVPDIKEDYDLKSKFDEVYNNRKSIREHLIEKRNIARKTYDEVCHKLCKTILKM